MNKGLWINQNTFVEVSDKKSLSSEIATRSRSIDYTSLSMYLPDPDPVLKKLGSDIRVYRELQCEPHVWACIQSRKSGVLSMNWDIDRGKAKSRQAKIIREVFEKLDLNRIISEILDAVLWGFQPLEILWEIQDGLILPKDIVGKPPEWFVFGSENELRFKTKNNFLGEALPDMKFLCPQYYASYNNPYGERTLSRVFWPVSFKKGGLKFWVVFTEKFGMPYIIGKHPRGASTGEITNLLDMLENMIQDAVAAIPDDASVEIVESSGKSASADIYKELINLCNGEISKAFLGQTLTTEIGDTGSYAAANTHMEVRQDLVDSDRKLVEQTFNRLIRWIDELNFASVNMPTFTLWQEEDVDKGLAERDKILTEAGVRFTKPYFIRAYGLDEEDIEIQPVLIKTPTEPSPVKEFAEPALKKSAQDEIDALADSLSDEELQNQAEDFLKPIIALINKGADYNAVMENLAEMYPDMNTDELEEKLTRAIFISDVWGRLNAGKK